MYLLFSETHAFLKYMSWPQCLTHSKLTFHRAIPHFSSVLNNTLNNMFVLEYHRQSNFTLLNPAQVVIENRKFWYNLPNTGKVIPTITNAYTFE